MEGNPTPIGKASGKPGGEEASQYPAPAGTRPGIHPDIDLVARIQASDPAAEAVLYERYGPRLYYLALSRTASAQDAEDARSETLLRVLMAIREHQLRSPAALASYCLRTLDNVTLEMMRRQGRDARLPQDSPFTDDPRSRMRRLFHDETVKHAIEQVIALLKPRERDFLRMFYYEDLPKEEIARRIGIADERVRLLKSRALRSFRERYQRLRDKIDDTSNSRRSLE